MSDPNQDPLAPWRPSQPLTEQELSLIDQRVKAGEMPAPQTLERNGRIFLTFPQSVSETTLTWLNKMTASVCQEGDYPLSANLAALALRLGLAGPGPNHPLSITSLNHLADSLLYLDRDSEALPLFQETLDARRRTLGPGHPDTLKNLTNLAFCLLNLAHATEAQLLLQEALETHRRTLGPEHPDTIESLNNLAFCLLNLGHAAEAWPLLQEVLGARRRTLGPGHPDTLRSVNNLAFCLLGLGRAAEARPLFQDVLEARRRTLGPGHPDTLRSVNNLALCLLNLGHAAEALPLCQMALEGLRRTRGPEHPDTLKNLTNLAACLLNLGRAAEAWPLLQEVLEAHRRTRGPEHPDTLRSLNQLALCFLNLGHAAEALPLYQEALEGLRRTLGPGHPDTLQSLSNLAFCLLNLGHAAEARPLCLEALEGLRRTLGPEHPGTLGSLSNLAVCLWNLGRAAEARPLCLEALEARRRTLGPEHPGTLGSLNDLAVCLGNLGRAAEALPLLQEALEARRRTLGPEHPGTLGSLNNLAACLGYLGRAAEARPLFLEALEARRRTLGPEHPDTLESIHILAFYLGELGCATEAQPLFLEALETRRRTLGPEHPDTLRSINGLALCLDHLGQAAEARSLYQEVLEVSRLTLGPEHPHTLISLNNLASLYAEQEDEVGLVEIVPLFLASIARAPHRDGNWPGHAERAVSLAIPLIESGVIPGWPEPLAAISRAFCDDLDLADETTQERLHEPFVFIHRTWLELAITQDPGALPTILAALHGRELAALLLLEMEDRERLFPPGDPRRRYLEVIRELRRRRFRVIPGGGVGKDGLLRGGLEGPTPPSSETIKARFAAQVEEERRLHEERRLLERRIGEQHPDFTLARGQIPTDLPALRRGLSADEALVLLFERHSPQATEVTAMATGHAAWVSLAETSQVIELPGLTRLQQPLTAYQRLIEGSRQDSARWRRLFSEEVSESPIEEHEPAVPTDPVTFLEDLPDRLAEALWQPLAEALPKVNTWHLVTHGALHALPLEPGLPRGQRMYSYPGLLFYHQRQHLPDPAPERPSQPRRLGIHVDQAGVSKYPIPFTETDARLLELLWTKQVERPEPAAATQARWREPQSQSLDVWCFSCHGIELDTKAKVPSSQTDPDAGNPETHTTLVPGRRETLLILDAATKLYLGMGDVLYGYQRPRLVVLGACVVGRIHDDRGEPVGLVSGLLLKGVDYVVAPVQPVQDFYLPLFTCLFHQSWKTLGSPEAALDEAKRRLVTGDWFADTEALLREAYPPVLREQIEQARAGESEPSKTALKVLQGCLLPEAVRDTLTKQGIGALPPTEALIEAILDRLCRERAQLPREAVLHLATWIRGFGRSRFPG